MLPDDIREWREKKGLTQSQLGALCGVGKSSVSQWESGATVPSGSAKVILEELVSGRRAIIPLTGLEERLLDELVTRTQAADRHDFLSRALLKAIQEDEVIAPAAPGKGVKYPAAKDLKKTVPMITALNPPARVADEAKTPEKK